MRNIAPYEIYAIRYGTHAARRAHENFIGGDPHDDAPMPLDYFLWAIVGRDRVFVVDTGFDETMGRRRGREFLFAPDETLRAVGVDPGAVEDVIITHLHYDHCGNHDLFPRARYHLQEREMQYATGRCMCHAPLRGAFEADDVVAMVRRVHAGRVAFHDGDAELAPGVSVHHVGGHTMGLQVVRVWTQRGWVVVASDASHLYANMEQGRPFPIVYSVAEMLEGHARAYALADSANHVVPGHDPEVTRRYPAARRGLEDRAVRLDLAPSVPREPARPGAR
ncbi:MAG: N-acyl homoserine lactonase family protein [Burkholderiales bacterium]|nr:N-acyl homoserine lactonase family protein [Burkholderiales bacterium]